MEICRENSTKQQIQVKDEKFSEEIDIQIVKKPIKLLKKSYDRMQKISMFWNYNLHKREKIYLSESECHIYKILPNSQK
jgi:hypothetical protein